MPNIAKVAGSGLMSPSVGVLGEEPPEVEPPAKRPEVPPEDDPPEDEPPDEEPPAEPPAEKVAPLMPHALSSTLSDKISINFVTGYLPFSGYSGSIVDGL